MEIGDWFGFVRFALLLEFTSAGLIVVFMLGC